MTRAALALGANLGAPRQALRQAVAGLADEPGVSVVAVSDLWRTAAVGGPAQPDYLNAVVVVESDLAAPALLDLAHRLEQAAGRERGERWGPRTLDVDVLAVGDVLSDDPALTLPHPRAHERAFVLVPWAQVEPGRVVPAAGQRRTVADWAREAQQAGEQRLDLEEAGPWWR